MVKSIPRRGARAAAPGDSRAFPARRVIYSVAASLDGFIARPDGDVGWLPAPGPGEEWARFYASVDTVLMGRRTWEAGRSLGQTHFPGKKNYVFSTRLRDHPPEIEVVSAPVSDFLRELRGKKGKDIWLVGGAGLFASFLDAGEVDAVVVHVVPKLIGEGIALVAPRHRDVPMRLLSAAALPDGLVRLEYALARAGVPPGGPPRARKGA